MENFEIDVNQFPSLTWNFLNINRAHLEFSSEFKSCVSISGAKEIENSALYDSIKTGLGEGFDKKFDSLLQKNGIKTLLFTAESKNQVQKIELFAQENEASVCDIIIHAKENSQVSYIFVYKSEPELLNAQLGVRIRVLAQENSHVHICCVNLLGKNAVHFNSVGSNCKDNATIEITELELGGKKTFSGTFNSIEGYRSRFLGRAAYVVKGESFLDMNQVALQTGKSSESRFSVDGVLLEKAKKTWRGTIDFKKGCADSVGDEQEDVLLLSPDVVNKSLPVILCDEEAVEGRHGCSIGKVDMEKLFYMQSRGVDEKTARELLTKAKVSKVSRFIPDESLVEEINSFVEAII